MKRILLFLLFYLAVLQSSMSQTQEQLNVYKASSQLFQSKYYKANVWDVFRSPAYAEAGVLWNLYYFNAPYDAITDSPINWGTSNNRYIQFDLVQASSGNYTDDVWNSGNTFNIVLKLYESDGTFVKDLCAYGVFMGFGDKGFLFNQDNYYGTFFANDSYATGASVSYTPTTGVLTKLSELSSYNYSPQLIKPTVSTTSFTYNGQQQGVTIATNSAYTITGTTSAINVGTYTVTISLNDKVNNSWSDGTKDDVVINWSITLATYDMSGAGWNYTEPFTWDGTEKTVLVTGLPAGVTVSSYTGNTATNAGTYTATALLSYDMANYNEPVIPALSWTIEQPLVIAKPTVSTTSFTYNGQQQGVTIATNSAYTITGTTSAINVGTYTVTISLNDKVNNSWSDGTKDDVVISWGITRATYDMSAAGWDYTEPFTYDGTEKTVLVTGLPAGVTVSSYTGNTATNAGTYTATALLSYDMANYNEPVISSLDWVIKTEYLNLSIIKLWDNTLAVSNGNKYDDIRNATFRWYQNGVLLQGSQQYISFEGSIPAGLYEVEIVINGNVAVTLNYTQVAKNVAKAYPNPVQTGQSISVEMGEARPDDEQAEVLSISGCPVKASVERQASGYRISGLSNGTYLVRVFTSEQTIATLKIIVK